MNLKACEIITKLNQESQNQKLRLFAKFDIQTKLKIIVNQKQLFHKLKQKYSDVDNNILTLLFVDPTCFDKGIGYQAWLEIEKRYPQTKTWTTETPTFLMKNVTFYVNKCGFHIIRVNDPKKDDSMYVFQKIMKQ